MSVHCVSSRKAISFHINWIGFYFMWKKKQKTENRKQKTNQQQNRSWKRENLSLFVVIWQIHQPNQQHQCFVTAFHLCKETISQAKCVFACFCSFFSLFSLVFLQTVVPSDAIHWCTRHSSFVFHAFCLTYTYTHRYVYLFNWPKCRSFDVCRSSFNAKYYHIWCVEKLTNDNKLNVAIVLY